MSIKESARSIVDVLFLIFVVLPLGIGVLFLASDFPDIDTDYAIDLLINAVEPWWLGIVEVAPYLFVVIAFVLVYLNREEYL